MREKMRERKRQIEEMRESICRALRREREGER